MKIFFHALVPTYAYNYHNGHDNTFTSLGQLPVINTMDRDLLSTYCYKYDGQRSLVNLLLKFNLAKTDYFPAKLLFHFTSIINTLELYIYSSLFIMYSINPHLCGRGTI